MNGITKSDFLLKYNDGQGLAPLSDPSNRQSKTQLDLKGGRTDAEFVKDMSALSPQEFKEVAALMNDSTKKAYLYNKYPQFFERWDHGEGMLNARMHGQVTADEIDRKGGMDSFLEELDQAITDPRDRELLASLSLFVNSKPQAEAMKDHINPSAANPLQGAFKK